MLAFIRQAILDRKLRRIAADIENTSTAELKAIYMGKWQCADHSLLLRVQEELAYRQQFQANSEITITIRRD